MSKVWLITGCSRGLGSALARAVLDAGHRLRGTPGLGGYQSAKWAVGGFSEVLAREVAPLGIRVTCVEPGGMRTEMFGLSMLADSLAPDYEPTVGSVIRATFGRAENARGDPAKMAQAILRLADEKHPPVHLLLGSDAVAAAAAAIAARVDEDARWKTLSLSTDFDGPGDLPGGGRGTKPGSWPPT